MSRQKKKDQKRERLERAARNREQLEERRVGREQKREERRTAGMSRYQQAGLHECSWAKWWQSWCVLGFLIGMVLISFVTILGGLTLAAFGWGLEALFGTETRDNGVVIARLAQLYVWKFAWVVFLPSFVGMFVFQFVEHSHSGEAFGRGQELDELLEVGASSYQTKVIKAHTVDTLKIGPTVRDRLFPLFFLGLPMLWYGLLVSFWFFVPSAYNFGENATLIEMGLPFALPLPFVLAGIALLSLPRTFVFDRTAGRLRITNWWSKRILLLDDVKSLQLIPGQSIEKGNYEKRRPRLSSYSTVQLNLVLGNAEFPRVNISHDIARQSAAEIGQLLSQFLNVPFENAFAGPHDS
jgi:hypothetical protein